MIMKRIGVPLTYKNGEMVDRIGGSNLRFRSTVTRTTLHSEELQVENVKTEFNSEMKYTKLSSLINQLQNLLDNYGDGYVISGSNEMTTEFFGLSVVTEHIEFEGLPETINPVVDNKFFSID